MADAIGTALVRPAEPGDRASIEKIVSDAGLPTLGLFDAWRSWVAESDGVVVGTASLERYGDALMLRGVAVKSAHRGRKVGEALVGAALGEAAGIGPVALLTETAGDWFLRFGFEPVARESLDRRLEDSIQLKELCPTTATALIRRA